MSNEHSVPSISPISGISTSSVPAVPPTVADLTLAVMQAQMVAFSQASVGNGPASIDLQSLQAALKSGNIPEAQAALARLQRESKVIGSGNAPANYAGTSPVADDSNRAGGRVAMESATESSIDTRA